MIQILIYSIGFVITFTLLKFLNREYADFPDSEDHLEFIFLISILWWLTIPMAIVMFLIHMLNDFLTKLFKR